MTVKTFLFSINEMSTVGYFGFNKGSRDFKVTANDENLKNKTFHLYYKKDGDKDHFEVVIQILDFTVLQFKKGEEKRLPRDIFKELIKFFGRHDDEFEDEKHTYWKSLVAAWNKENPENRIPKDTPLPDKTDFTYASKLNLK